MRDENQTDTFSAKYTTKIDMDLWPVTDRRRFVRDLKRNCYVIIACRLYIGHNGFDIWDHGMRGLWILLATQSFEEDAIIGNNSVILRETIGIASNVAIVFTMFVRVSLKIFLVRLSRSATIFVKSRGRRFARNQCFQMRVYVVNIVIIARTGNR